MTVYNNDYFNRKYQSYLNFQKISEFKIAIENTENKQLMFYDSSTEDLGVTNKPTWIKVCILSILTFGWYSSYLERIHDYSTIMTEMNRRFVSIVTQGANDIQKNITTNKEANSRLSAKATPGHQQGVEEKKKLDQQTMKDENSGIQEYIKSVVDEYVKFAEAFRIRCRVSEPFYTEVQGESLLRTFRIPYGDKLVYTFLSLENIETSIS